MDKIIESNNKIVAVLDSTVYARETAEVRIKQREREKDWITTRLNATERDLGDQGDRSLVEETSLFLKK